MVGMGQYKEEIMNKLNERWSAMPYDDRVAATAMVFEGIVEAIKDGGTSFRGLIYDYLGFGPDAYTPLYLAGGMEITNYIHDSLQEEA